MRGGGSNQQTGGWSTEAFVCDLHADPGSQICNDCGIKAWDIPEGDRTAHEDFYVHDELWDAFCPDDGVVAWSENGVSYRVGTFVLCIGCFEIRLGRQLSREDFAVPPQRMFGRPPSYRFRRRWKAQRH